MIRTCKYKTNISNTFFNDYHKLIKILFSSILYYKKSDSKNHKYLSNFHKKINKIHTVMQCIKVGIYYNKQI